VEAAQEKLKIQQDNVALYAKTLNAANLRLSAGDIASADVSRIHVDALRAENDLRQAQADLEKTQTILAYFIGKEKQARQIKVSESWPEIQPQSSSESIEFLIAQRPDVQAAEARIRLSDQGRNLAQSLKTRDITVGMQYEHFPQDSKNTIGGGISIPLFTNYEFQGEIARSEVNYTAALESREQIQAQAIGEIEKARADLEAATDRVNRFNTVILNEAEKSASAAEFAYQHGAMGVLDLLDARRTLRSLQLEAATAKADYAKSLAAWYAALSGETNK
jgi:cobalt-zinc-cadmium efflux system outer membrane protein